MLAVLPSKIRGTADTVVRRHHAGGARVRIVLIFVILMAFSSLTDVTSGHTGAAAGGRETALCGGPAATVPATPTVASASLTSDASPVAAADSPILETVADIPLSGGTSRFDYQSLDPTTGRLYIAHMGAGELVVFDIATREVITTIADLPTVTGVLAVPEAGFVYAAVAGDHQVAIIDDETLEVVARVGDIGFPDGLAYAPSAHQVFVSDESGGGELVIDTQTNEVVTTIDLGGEAGNTHVDATSGCIVVAVQTLGELVFIDPATDQIVDHLAMDTECDGPHGFLIDPRTHLAFVTCEGNALLLVVDLATGQATATFPVGEGPDVLAFDPGWNRLYVASESGVVSVFDEDRGTLQPLGEITMSDAHSIEVDPETHLVYLPLAHVNGGPVLRIMSSVPPEN